MKPRGLSACEQLLKQTMLMGATTGILGMSQSGTYESNFFSQVETLSFADDDNEDLRADLDTPVACYKHAPLAVSQSLNLPQSFETTPTPVSGNNLVTPPQAYVLHKASQGSSFNFVS